MENCTASTLTTITTATTTKSSTTTTTTTTNSNDEGESKANIKKEVFNDEIKDFAETAMNELLGWYGYGNNNARDGGRTSRKTALTKTNCASNSGSNSSEPASPKYTDTCGWCGKPVDETTGLSSAAATFCSELCFSQSRRANFKKNKTCDWCRHIRHTVSYVDSQDGATQLQFCSDKCLNQYKMHIFWRETRAHLEIHPHLHGNESSSGTLITPDLWMTNSSSNKSSESSPPSTTTTTQEPPPQTSPLPLITVAHPSKLMALPQSSSSSPPPLLPPSTEVKRKKIQKKKRKLQATIVQQPPPSQQQQPLQPLHQQQLNDMPQDLSVRHQSKETITKPLEESLNKNKIFPNGLLPPPTLLFPYPIILPLPIPIPIPIPVLISNNNNNNNKKIETQENSSQTEDLSSSSSSSSSNSSLKVDEGRRPLRKRKGVMDEKNVKKVIPI